jgi:hypothetical protein
MLIVTHPAQPNVSLQYTGVAATLVGTGRAKVQRACNVCRAAVKLSARVDEQESVGINRPVWQ